MTPRTGLRPGQKLMIAIGEIDPVAYNFIISNDLDCFYSESKFDTVLKTLKELWSAKNE